MRHSLRIVPAVAVAALLGLAPALAPRTADAQGKGNKNGHHKQKSKGDKGLRTSEEHGDVWVDRDGRRVDRGDDGRWDDRDVARAGRGAGRGGRSFRVPPGHMPPPGMCRVWIDGVPPGRQPAPTDCATAEWQRPSNSRVIYGARTADRRRDDDWSRRRGDDRRQVIRDDSCPDVNGDGYRERVLETRNGQVVHSVCR